jgi:KDO2-lipid IV(A) lauroyltransferase
VSLSARLQAAAANCAIGVLRLFGPATSSSLAGGIAGLIGPLLPTSRIAHANLAAALPELDAASRRRIVRGVWTQLGRTVGELPHIGRLREGAAAGPGWEIEGLEIIEDLAAKGGPAIFFSAHMGNWEILPMAAGAHGLELAGIYRATKNPAMDGLIMALRRRATGQGATLFAKGAPGARQAIGHLSRGGCLAMLVDQKLNEGIEARLFGLPAMTSPAAAIFALRFGCPVIPVLARRTGPARFRILVEPPLSVPLSGESEPDRLAITQAMNDTLERWIRAEPASWLWLHRRWPRDVVPGAGRRRK